MISNLTAAVCLLAKMCNDIDCVARNAMASNEWTQDPQEEASLCGRSNMPMPRRAAGILANESHKVMASLRLIINHIGSRVEHIKKEGLTTRTWINIENVRASIFLFVVKYIDYICFVLSGHCSFYLSELSSLALSKTVVLQKK